MHAGYGPGLTHRNLGELGGVETVTLTEQLIAPHTHPWQVASAVGNQLSPAGHALAATPAIGRLGYNAYNNTATDTSAAPSTMLGPSGSGASHDNMQPTLVVYFIIAIEGTYPVRP